MNDRYNVSVKLPSALAQPTVIVVIGVNAPTAVSAALRASSAYYDHFGQNMPTDNVEVELA